MKKNKNIRFFGIILLILIFSFFSSFLINNFNILKLPKEDRILKTIEIDSIKCTGLEITDNDSIKNNLEKSNLLVDYKGFINKLIVNYDSDIENVSVLVNYNGLNYYSEQKIKEEYETLNSRINKAVTKINDDVSNIELSFHTKDFFEIKNIQIDNRISINYYLFAFIFLLFIGIFILFLYFKFDLFQGKIEYLFLSLTLIIGFLLITLQPNTTSLSWDDQIHYSTMFRLYEFDKVTEWTKADNNMTEVSPFTDIDTVEERKLQNEYLNKATEIVKVENNSPFITYDQIGYLIPGLILKLSSIFKIPFSLKIFLTKLSMLLAYSITLFFSIKIIPRGKRIMSILGMMPLSLFIVTQFSYDQTIIACIALFVAQFINVIENKNIKINIWNALLLCLPIITASFIKAVYAPLILLILLIPKEKFESKRCSKYYKIGVFFILFLLISTFVLPTVTKPPILGDLRGGDTSVAGQLNYILKNPIGYIKVLNDTAINSFFSKFISISNFYHHGYINEIVNIDVESSFSNSYYILLLVLIFVIITDSNKIEIKNNIKFNKILKSYNLILILGIILLIWTALYLSFTPVGLTTINGVQNRYFIPLLFPIILISFNTDKIKSLFNQKKYDVIIMGLYFIILINMLFNMYFIKFCI